MNRAFYAAGVFFCLCGKKRFMCKSIAVIIFNFEESIIADIVLDSASLLLGGLFLNTCFHQNIFKENIDELYYQKFYISLPHEMYINSPNVIDQEIFSNINFEDAVGLGDNITAIDEWNREIKDKNQKRTKELFDNEYLEKIDEKCNENQSESESKSESESEVESESTYCSKRWKILEKLNKRFKNNNSK